MSEGRENKQLIFHNLDEDNIKLTFNVAQILFSKSSIMDAIHTTKISSSEDGIEFKYFARVLTTYFDNMKPNVNISHTIKKLRCPGTREWLLTPVFFFFFPLQESCLENSMDRGAWWATVHGVAKTEKLIHKKGIVDQNIDYIQAYLPFQRIYGGKKTPHQRPHLFFTRWWAF